MIRSRYAFITGKLLTWYSPDMQLSQVTWYIWIGPDMHLLQYLVYMIQSWYVHIYHRWHVYLNLSQYEYMTSNLYIWYMQSHVSLQGFTNIYKNQARKYISYVNLYFWMHSRYHACTVPFYTYGREFQLPDSIYDYIFRQQWSRYLFITSGGKAKNGALILTFPENPQHPQIPDEEYRKLIHFLCCVPTYVPSIAKQNTTLCL